MSKRKKQKTEKQAFRKWVICMVVAFVAGVFGSSFIRLVKALFEKYADGVEVNLQYMLYLATGVFLAVNVIGILVTYIYYKKAKNMIVQWDGEDEEVLDRIEDKLDHALLPITVVNSSNYFLFGVTAYISIVKMSGKGMLPLLFTLVDVVIFIGSSLIFVALQKKCVDLTKQLNPEKKGNIFDKNFSKEWLASCDEAQQLMIYKASYKSYQNVASTCQILWLVTFIGMLAFDIGLMPIFCVSVIMLVMQVSFYLESKKLERGKK